MVSVKLPSRLIPELHQYLRSLVLRAKVSAEVHSVDTFMPPNITTTTTACRKEYEGIQLPTFDTFESLYEVFGIQDISA